MFARFTTLAVALSLASVACSSSSSPEQPPDAGHDARVADAHVTDAKHDATRDAKPSSDASDAGVDAPPEIPEDAGLPLLGKLDCDPMVPSECGFPFPSSVWTVPDTSTPTGVHLAFGKATLPITHTGVRVQSGAFETRDGFSPGGTIITHFPNASSKGLPDQNHLGVSVTIGFPTLIIEADTGTLIPHFSELDVRTEDPDEQAFMIHPMERLKDATRYIVAIRDVKDVNGNTIPANPVFAALRDDSPSSDPSVAPRRTLYADIMSKLKTAGVDKLLQLAWDFTTASKENTTSWLTSIRDQALAAVGDAGPSYTIDASIPNPNPHTALRLVGNMTVPFFLDTTGIPAKINFNDAGVPAQNGTASFPFIVQIPNSVVQSGQPAPILINAHGLLGVESEGEDSYLAEICDREGYVSVAVQLIGMCQDDDPFVVSVVGSSPKPDGGNYDLSEFEYAVERQHQGLVNELLAVRMLMGGMSTDPATMPMGHPTIDPSRRFYRGDSQGGIFGGTFMTISTDVTRGLLGEPGAPYSLLLDRSNDFSAFFTFLALAYPRPLDVQFDIVLIDALWDRTAPNGYIPYMRENMLEGTPSHDVLIEAAFGDEQVTPLGAEYEARSIGAKDLEPLNQTDYGITPAASGFTGSALVEWKFGLPPAPTTDTPPTVGPDPHDELRYVTQEQDQADQFFRTGVVNQLCPDGGPCVVSCIDGGAEAGGNPDCHVVPP